MIFNAAIGAGERDIANIILTHMEANTAKCHKSISADSGFIAAATNGHYSVLYDAYMTDGWKTRVRHSRAGIVAAAIRAGAPAEHITAHVNRSNVTRGTVRLVLEHRRFDLLEQLWPGIIPCQRAWQLSHFDVEKAGPEIIRDAVTRGVYFEFDVCYELMKFGYVTEALMVRKRWHHGWPKHALALAAQRASPEDLHRLIAAGCPWDPMAIEVTLERGDPEVLRLVAAAPGAHWSEELLEKIRGLGDAAVALARSAGAPP